MRKAAAVLVALIALVFISSPTHAADRPHELGASFALSDFDSGARSYHADVDLAIPLGNSVFALGPAVSADYIKPEDGESLSTTNVGFLLVLNTTPSFNGLFFALRGYAPLSDDVEGYFATPSIGFKGGGDQWFFKAEVARPYHFSEGEFADLSSTEVRAGFGWRFGS